MFPSWRLKIREAQIALRDGRWDEASALLGRESVRNFLPAKRLSHKVAAQLVDRAQQRLEQGESSAGWQDLEQASRLGGCEDQIAALREDRTRLGLQRVKQLLAYGETSLASEQISRLEKRRLGGEERRAWKLIVRLISRAKTLAYEGSTMEAAEVLQRALRLLPDPQDQLADEIAARQAELKKKTPELSRLSLELHEAVTAENWSKVLKTAEALLELAPEHQAARKARRRAWEAVGMAATQVYRGSRPLAPQNGGPQNGRWNRRRKGTLSTIGASSAKVDTVNIKCRSSERMFGKRMVAWIDAVGGYLICLGDEVVLGQPSVGGADIPILADLSREHATIRREGEAYVLTPIHRVSIDGQPVVGPTVLTNGTTIVLGDSVRLKFHQPHALSATAVLALESHHKTEPAVDRIVLMSESCILGPQQHSHIVCRDWSEELVLFRRGEELQFRTSAEVELDGEPAASGTTVAGDCRIEGANISLSFEEI